MTTRANSPSALTRAKSDGVSRRGTSETPTIECISSRRWTRALKELRIRSRPARRRCRVCPGTTIHGVPKSRTCTHTRHGLTRVVHQPQLRRALGVDVRRARGDGASTARTKRDHRHGGVKAGDDADLVGVESATGAKVDLEEGGRKGAARTVAFDDARAAIACLTVELAGGGVGGAAGAGP